MTIMNSNKKKGDLISEELESEMGRKRQLSSRKWNLRSTLNSFIAMFMGFIIIYAITLTAKNANRWPEAEVEELEGKSCDLFSGRWVFDNMAYPLYSEKKCMFMSDQSACEKFGRKDLTFQNWRWQPHGCDLPRFNATRLLEKLSNKRLTFVGDSLNRNQWISLVCFLDSVIPAPYKSLESIGSLTTFKAKEYNASIEFYWSPLLVESNSDHPIHHRIADRIVRVQSIEKHAKLWMDADVLVFNSYLWWRRDIMKVLWGSFDNNEGIYKEIETLRAYELALKTWSDWLEFNVDHNKTKLYFVSLSPTHLWGDEWGVDSNLNCYNETKPITTENHWGKGSNRNMMQVVESTVNELSKRGVNVQILNVTQLSEYRKDGHPSVYRKQWEQLTEEQIANPSSYADCIHWCLPGVPDVWNELLYAYIISE